MKMHMLPWDAGGYWQSPLLDVSKDSEEWVVDVYQWEGVKESLRWQNPYIHSQIF